MTAPSVSLCTFLRAPTGSTIIAGMAIVLRLSIARNKQWVLRDFIRENRSSYIKLAIPGASYSVMLFRNPDYSLHCWYINLEDPENPMHCTLIGFDCTDQILDVIIEPNLKDWR